MSRALSLVNALRTTGVRRAPSNVRLLATPSTKPFSQALESGPSFDDFVAGDVDRPERVILGNKQACVKFDFQPISSSIVFSVEPGCLRI